MYARTGNTVALYVRILVRWDFTREVSLFSCYWSNRVQYTASHGYALNHRRTPFSSHLHLLQIGTLVYEAIFWSRMRLPSTIPQETLATADAVLSVIMVPIVVSHLPHSSVAIPPT